MSFNIFGPATTDNIKVGYISTDRGFVEGLSISEANEYAKLNPETQFIFKNRKYIKFLNINQVNELTPNDLVVGINTCEGVQLSADCSPPEVYFYGGNGVGVQGNPVFGSDGSLLAIDLVSGGFGYQYPPVVEVKDACGIGVGAVTKAIIEQGVVIDVEVGDPGNGFSASPGDGYPVTLKLKAVIVEDPGINYNCGVDQIVITPDFGCNLSYTCDSFGRISSVNVNGGCYGFTTYPEITIKSETGINATFRPQFEVVRDPIVLPEKIIQVTDLVGLKQTGYVDGRAYYGSVFYKKGVRYAGFYETVGNLVQVYDTLQESITTQVTTPASAILRQGTDVTNNDPRLNIPGTPENLI
jgi:hypothetical protein